MSVYSPKQELSLDEAMIPRLGHLKFRMYNPVKITKYGVLERMVCEAVSGYICNMVMYTAEEKLEDPVLSLFDTNLGHNYHIYHDNFYNIVRLATTLLNRNVSVCGIMRADRGIPCDLEREDKHLIKGESVFWRKGDIMVQMWEDKRLVQMISMVHGTTLVNTGTKDRKQTWKKKNCLLFSKINS